MDKKQVHKLGKKINKPIKFVKKNAMGLLIAIPSTISAIITIMDKIKSDEEV